MVKLNAPRMRNGLVSGEIGPITPVTSPFTLRVSLQFSLFTILPFPFSYRERENNLKIQRGEAKVRELSLSLAGGGR